MNATANNEYNVLVTRLSNGQSGYWQATVMGFPDIAEKAFSREQVIQQVQHRLAEVMRHSEIVSLTVPAPAVLALTEDEDELRAKGWKNYGAFKNDPEALKLFDEIEEERKRSTAPAAPTIDEERLRELGWDDHGLFKDDPEALKLFDEIEEERNRNLCGME